MDKNDIYRIFTEKRIEYTAIDHIAVFTMEEMLAQNLPEVETVAKNLFLRDDKNREFYLVTAREDARVNMKELQTAIGSRRLTFAKADQLSEILGLYAGAVSPLGVLNDSEKRVHFIYDDTYIGQKIGMHPLDNTRTVYADFDAVLNLIKPYCKETTAVRFEKILSE